MKFDSMRAWNEGVAMLRANRETLLPLAGVFIMLPGLALLLFFPAPEVKSGASFATIVAAMRIYFNEFWPQILIAALITSIGSLAIVALLTLRERPTVGGAIRHALRAILPMIAAQVLFGMAVMLGGGSFIGLAAATGIAPVAMIAVLISCGVAAYLFIRIIVLSPVVVSRPGISPVAALRQAAGLTRGNFWQILAFFLMVTVAAMIVTGLVDGLIRAIVSLALGDEAARFTDAVMTSATETVASVLNIALICATFRQLSDGSVQTASNAD